MFMRGAPRISGHQAISELIEITIGDIKQWIYLRGENKNNPILLMLHGGPGTGQIGFIRKFQSELEKHFVIVQWDQRGAGLSYSKKIPEGSMTIDQFVSDTIELTEYILKRFGRQQRQQLYLVGHSWGTILGMLAIDRAPHLYKRYFGVAQVVDVMAGNKLSYEKLLTIVQEQKDEKAYQALTHIGPPPWKNLRHDRVHQNYVDNFGGGITRDGKMVRKILLSLLTSKEYTLYDVIRFMRGQFFSMQHLQQEMEQTNLAETITKVDIPIYFLMGTYDLMTPVELAEQYFIELSAEEKQIILFEKSAHTPIFEEPEKFLKILLNETNKD